MSGPVTKAQILRAVKRRIAARKELFICHAISDVRVGTPQQKSQLRTWVQRLLDGHVTYDSWLYKKHPGVLVNSTREGRLQWLDWMIAELEKP